MSGRENTLIAISLLQDLPSIGSDLTTRAAFVNNESPATLDLTSIANDATHLDNHASNQAAETLQNGHIATQVKILLRWTARHT